MGLILGRTLAACGGGGSLCIYGLCMGFGVHTALINLHPVSGSVEDGFELCRMYTGHKARLECAMRQRHVRACMYARITLSIRNFSHFLISTIAKEILNMAALSLKNAHAPSEVTGGPFTFTQIHMSCEW